MRPPSLRLSFLLAVLLSFTPAAAAAGSATLTGRVADADGRGVPGARVLLVSGHAVAASARTGEDGRFELTPPAEGSYLLRASAEGFRADPVMVTATAAAQDLGTITLHVSAITEAIVVSAAQVEVPWSTAASAVTVLSGEELRARQYESVADALRTVPGLTVSSNGGRGSVTSVFPRGGESDYTLVFVDGVQANAFGGGFDFAHLPIANIDRIEIVRGPQSSLYGANAIGSVVRIVTRRGGPPSVDGSVEAGSFGTTRLTAATSGGSGGWAWGASGERLESDGLNGRIAAGGQTVTNDAYVRSSAAAGAAWSAPGGATVRGDLRIAQDERGAPGPFGSNPGGTFSGIDERAFGTGDRLLVAGGATVPLPARFRAHGLLTHARTDTSFTDFFGGAPSVSDASSRRTTGRVQIDHTLSAALEASAGAELLHERGTSTFIVSNGAGVPVDRSMNGVFVEGRWHREARLFVTAGLRVERIARDTLAPDGGFANRPQLPRDTILSANPKIAAAWYVRSAGGEFTRLRAAAGTGIRPPDALEIAFTDNPALKPERSRSADAGIDIALARGLLLIESTAFFNDYDDLIVAVGSFSSSSRYRTDNISNATARGLELAATGRARAGRVELQLRTAYTLLRTRILAADGAAAAPSPFTIGDRLLRRPAHQFSIDVLAAAGPVSAFLRGGGRSLVRDVDPSWGTFGGIFDAPGYASWDAGATWAFVPRLHLLARVTNLFDRQYEETLGFPAPGRGAFVGLRVAAGR